MQGTTDKHQSQSMPAALLPTPGPTAAAVGIDEQLARQSPLPVGPPPIDMASACECERRTTTVCADQGSGTSIASADVDSGDSSEEEDAAQSPAQRARSEPAPDGVAQAVEDAVDASGGRKLRFGSLEIGCCRAC